MTRIPVSRSLLKRGLITLLLTAGCVLAYEAGTIDSHGAFRSRKGADASHPITSGASLAFEATAYCKGDLTSAGVNVRSGIVASDPAVLPEGSIISIEGVPAAYRGIYTVLDTGPAVQGRAVDVYIWSCYEALDFGRRDVTVTVLRLGWEPKNTAPGIR